MQGCYTLYSQQYPVCSHLVGSHLLDPIVQPKPYGDYLCGSHRGWLGTPADATASHGSKQGGRRAGRRLISAAAGVEMQDSGMGARQARYVG